MRDTDVNSNERGAVKKQTSSVTILPVACLDGFTKMLFEGVSVCVVDDAK